MTPEAEALRNVLRAEKARRPELTDPVLVERIGGDMSLKSLRAILRGDREPKISEVWTIVRAIGVPMRKIVDDVLAELGEPDVEFVGGAEVTDLSTVRKPVDKPLRTPKPDH